MKMKDMTDKIFLKFITNIRDKFNPKFLRLLSVFSQPYWIQLLIRPNAETKAKL